MRTALAQEAEHFLYKGHSSVLDFSKQTLLGMRKGLTPLSPTQSNLTFTRCPNIPTLWSGCSSHVAVVSIARDLLSYSAPCSIILSSPLGRAT